MSENNKELQISILEQIQAIFGADVVKDVHGYQVRKDLFDTGFTIISDSTEKLFLREGIILDLVNGRSVRLIVTEWGEIRSMPTEGD